MEPAALSYVCLSAVTLALQPHQQTGPNSAPRVQARAWGWACLELGRTAASRVSRRNWRGALAICLARVSGQETPCLAVPSCSSAQRNLFFAEALRLHARPPFGAPRGRMLSVCHQVVRAAGYSLLLFLQVRPASCVRARPGRLSAPRAVQSRSAASCAPCALHWPRLLPSDLLLLSMSVLGWGKGASERAARPALTVSG